MTDVTVKRFDEMESALGGVFVRARAELGVSAFGMQVINLPPGFDEPYTAHAHLGMPAEMGFNNHGQEEVYVPLRGRGTLIADDQRWELEPGMAVRVGPAQWRQVVTHDEPCSTWRSAAHRASRTPRRRSAAWAPGTIRRPGTSAKR
jgi:hypothetical protein